MADDQAGGGFGVKIDLGIAESIKALDAILERRGRRKQDDRLDTIDDLDAIDAIVQALFNASRELLKHFRDRLVVASRREREILIKATRDYLEDRVLLPQLLARQGQIAAKARSGRYKKQATAALTAVDGRIEEFKERIHYQGLSGVGWKELENLRDLAVKCSKTEAVADPAETSKAVDAIVEEADRAARYFDHSPLADLYQLIGEAKGYLS
jgi:hypothetical protein